MFENMLNKYLNFDNIEFNSKYVKNSTDLILLPDIIEKYLSDDMTSEITLEDNRLIEGISYELYDSTDYWDILMLVNGITRFDELPVSYDIVLKRTDEKLVEWKKLSRLTRGAIDEGKSSRKYNELLEQETTKNEKYRNLKYVQNIYIEDLISELDNLIGIPKINSNIIVNKEDIPIKEG